MTNNDILRRIRYTFDLSDRQMVGIFSAAGHTVTRKQILEWLLRDDEPSYKNCSDAQLARFLSGWIIEQRGHQEGREPKAEKKLNNNIIFRKLKIALNLKSDEILAIMDLADFPMSEHELSAFFRKEGHKHYRQCKDQILRNFLKGIQRKYRPEM